MGWLKRLKRIFIFPTELGDPFEREKRKGRFTIRCEETNVSGEKRKEGRSAAERMRWEGIRDNFYLSTRDSTPENKMWRRATKRGTSPNSINFIDRPMTRCNPAPDQVCERSHTCIYKARSFKLGWKYRSAAVSGGSDLILISRVLDTSHQTA